MSPTRMTILAGFRAEGHCFLVVVVVLSLLLF